MNMLQEYTTAFPFPPSICNTFTLQGRGNYQNYDAHIVPVLPANPANPVEFNYYPCEPPALQHPYPGGCAPAKKAACSNTCRFRLHIH
jgi:hypothetical protein